jgi:hypothetical protein
LTFYLGHFLYFMDYYVLYVIYGILMKNFFLLVKLEDKFFLFFIFTNIILLVIGMIFHFLLQNLFFNFHLLEGDYLGKTFHRSVLIHFFYVYILIFLDTFSFDIVNKFLLFF